MNATIERLAEESQLIGMRPHLDGIYAESLEAFAKAVARECAEIVTAVIAYNEDDPSETFAKAIRERFGITESEY